MLDVRGLKAEMVRHGYTQKQIANLLGISEKTLINKMKKGVFGTDEAKTLIDVLHLDDPNAIFFANDVN